MYSRCQFSRASESGTNVFFYSYLYLVDIPAGLWVAHILGFAARLDLQSDGLQDKLEQAPVEGIDSSAPIDASRLPQPPTS